MKLWRAVTPLTFCLLSLSFPFFIPGMNSYLDFLILPNCFRLNFIMDSSGECCSVFHYSAHTSDLRQGWRPLHTYLLENTQSSQGLFLWADVSSTGTDNQGEHGLLVHAPLVCARSVLWAVYTPPDFIHWPCPMYLLLLSRNRRIEVSEMEN